MDLESDEPRLFNSVLSSLLIPSLKVYTQEPPYLKVSKGWQPLNGNRLLEIRELSKKYPGVEALTQANLEVFSEQVHVLVRENRAGKSTLMRILLGLELPDSGTTSGQVDCQRCSTQCRVLQVGTLSTVRFTE
jgi:ABC-type transport system involved in cytochrome bd biosynthesis fused ATPase/permease subunit